MYANITFVLTIITATVKGFLLRSTNNSKIMRSSTSYTSRTTSTKRNYTQQQQEPPRSSIPLVLLTWNVDGLNPTHKLKRAEMVVQEVKDQVKDGIIPDVIFLQEVVPDVEIILRRGLALADDRGSLRYEFIPVDDKTRFNQGYYTMVGLKQISLVCNGKKSISASTTAKYMFDTEIELLEEQRLEYEGKSTSAMGRDLHYVKLSVT